ncbi:hypothetical protein RhiirC2_821824 [Rhizophagus irregularis]|uniref:Uncharacterized protein n=1 Tax=Rhizophagus irregularis TaxID=588596 RepID=A0A2N1NJR2_9GLOM|nr:hypothetical protein RhiirC2_821824 [Rhizophagus irregularis]
MRRGWIDRKEVSVTLPNIFDEIVPCIRKIDTANFVVVDKPEYYLVLGNVWLMHTGYAVDRHHQYTLINLKRSKNKKGKKDNIAVESECSSSEDESEDEEVAYNNNAPPPIIMGTADTPNDFVTTFNDYLRQADGAQNIISAFL